MFLDVVPRATLYEDRARAHGVDANALGRQILGQGTVVVQQRRFQRIVGACAHELLQRRRGRDENHAGVIGFFQIRHGALDHPDRAEHVVLQVPAPGVLALCAAAADVGDDAVDAAEGLGAGIDPGLEGVAITHVHGLAESSDTLCAEIGYRSFHFFGVAGTDGHVAAFVRQRVRDRPTNALGPTGDQRL